MNDAEYNGYQLDRVTPDEDGKRILKIAGNHSETKWLNLTELQFQMIRAVLTLTPERATMDVVCKQPAVRNATEQVCGVVLDSKGVCPDAWAHVQQVESGA